ncbi:DUF1566 domain-containing protein [Ideonella sp.]|uniref:Lcl C-terminal domain-containing protein n=1 Tax=Ideonella sp. TaxID=1929293 RepID=UPI003BB778AE
MHSCPLSLGRWLALPLLAGLAQAALAACPSWPTAERYEVLAGGAEVRDTRTGLVWARCSVGQAWSGSTCTGSATGFTHEAALAFASTQSGWRLPNRRELSSLADKGCLNPAIDGAAFPSTPSSIYWSSSPYVGNASSAWYVSFSYGGDVNDSGRLNSSFAVRLVRASQ